MDELLFMAKWDNKIAIAMAAKGFRFSILDILLLGNPKDGLCSIASNMARARHMFTFGELIDIKNKKIEDTRNLALEMIKNGHTFSIKESILIGIPVTRRWENNFSTLKFLIDKGYRFAFSDIRMMKYLPNGSGWTIAHAMASNGHIFSMDEIVGMGNPSDKNGMSVAAVMAENGHNFCVEDIFILGNPSNISGETIAAIMARKGYRFSVAEILYLGNPVTIDGNSIGHLMALAGQKIKVSEIKALRNPKNIDGETIAHSLVQGGNPLTIDELMELKDPKDIFGVSVSQLMSGDYSFSKDEIKKIPYSEERYDLAYDFIQNGGKITFEDIMELGNPSDDYGWSLGYYLAANGYIFSVDQILALGDTRANEMTISLWMARNGHLFTFDEILRLNNPADNFGTTLAHLSISKTTFSVDQLIKLGNPADKDGDTVAHLMVKAGHVFSENEVELLGNPKNKKNDSLLTIMARKNKEPELVKTTLKYVTYMQPVDMDIDIKNPRKCFPGRDVAYCSDVYVNGVRAFNYCVELDDPDIEVFNPELYDLFMEKVFKPYCRVNITSLAEFLMNNFPD